MTYRLKKKPGEVWNERDPTVHLYFLAQLNSSSAPAWETQNVSLIFVQSALSWSLSCCFFLIILMLCMENLGWLIMYVPHVKMSLLLMDLIYLMYVLSGDGSCVKGKTYCSMHRLTGQTWQRTFISNPYRRDTVTKRLSTRTAAASLHAYYFCLLQKYACYLQLNIQFNSGSYVKIHH